MGMDPEMRREIAAAVRDDGNDIAMACGNSLAIEHRGRDAHSKGIFAGSEYRATSSVSLSAGGLDHLKRAQFLAAIGETESERPKAQVKPSSTRDPLRWFSLLPPPSLRQAQRNFRRAAETAAQCASAQLRMDAARHHYEGLRQRYEQTPRAQHANQLMTD